MEEKLKEARMFIFLVLKNHLIVLKIRNEAIYSTYLNKKYSFCCERFLIFEFIYFVK